MDASIFRPVRRDGSIPVHEQAYQTLKEALQSGRLAPGELLPSERRLGEHIGVSRVTLRKALDRLEDEGWLESAPGRGWLTATPVVEPPNALLSFTALAAARNLRVSSKILACFTRQATLDEAELLSTAPGAEVLVLSRVRYIDDMPVAIAETILPTKLVPGLELVDFTVESLYATLETQYGIVPTTAHYSLESRPAAKEWADHLDMEPGQPVLFARQRTLDQEGTPIELGTITYRGDRYRFEAFLRRDLQPAPTKESLIHLQ